MNNVSYTTPPEPWSSRPCWQRDGLPGRLRRACLKGCRKPLPAGVAYPLGFAARGEKGARGAGPSSGH